MVHGALEDLGVVGHHDEGPRAVLEELAEPPALGVVQVVAGLVQEEEVGGVEEGAPELEAHLLAAREGAAGALPVIDGEPQAHEAAVELHLVGVSAVVVQPILDLRRLR